MKQFLESPFLGAFFVGCQAYLNADNVLETDNSYENIEPDQSWFLANIGMKGMVRNKSPGHDNKLLPQIKTAHNESSGIDVATQDEKSAIVG